MAKIAIVQIRGTVRTHPDVRKTLELLRLKQKHACVVVDDNEVSRGMIKKIKDYVTYGNISEDLYVQMLETRGECVGKQTLKEAKLDAKKIAKEYYGGEVKLRDFEPKYTLKPFFRLHPPKGGFERGGIKKTFIQGGVLGERSDESIATLIQKML
ncbi:MAG: 50S ribosomal protein L30 [Nanoarchaeota archaeon]|nr:50S ribosomal protein L30 [Nanoarchaeota archaeon]